MKPPKPVIAEDTSKIKQLEKLVSHSRSYCCIHMPSLQKC